MHNFQVVDTVKNIVLTNCKYHNILHRFEPFENNITNNVQC
jgi:hypothetical protein